MTSHDSASLDALVRALPPVAELVTAVTRDAAALRRKGPSSRLPIAVQSAALEKVPAEREALASLLEHAVALVHDNPQPAVATMTDHDRLALEALYAVYGRPAIAVRDDQFGGVPAGWELLDAWRGPIEAAIRSVGRIERALPGGLNEPIGTGFLVANDLVMTARHVARLLGARGGAPPVPGRPLDASWGLRLDWRGEDGRPGAFARFKILEVAWEHPQADVALLRLGRDSDPDGARMPAPLPLCGAAPARLDAALAYLVGYPGLGGEGNLSWPQLERIFPGVRATKRLQPGRLLSPALEGAELRHDCSTLGGSSGSPVFLLERGAPVVIAVHVAGTPFVANQAVPSWLLAQPASGLTPGTIRFVADSTTPSDRQNFLAESTPRFQGAITPIAELTDPPRVK